MHDRRGREVRRVRALFISRRASGHAADPHQPAHRFPALARGRDDLPRRRHRRRLAARQGLVLAGRIQQLVEIFLDKALAGTRIVVLPGNHDEFLREYLGTYFGEVEFVDRTVHTTAHGQDLSGHPRRPVRRRGRARQVAGPCRRLGLSRRAARSTSSSTGCAAAWACTYWSLSAWAKHKVKNAVSVIGRFEEALALEARETGVDGVICGHIHYADMHDRLGIHYINTGDWVESCTAVCETHEGQFEVVRWTPYAAGAEAQSTQKPASRPPQGRARSRRTSSLGKRKPRRSGADCFGGLLLKLGSAEAAAGMGQHGVDLAAIGQQDTRGSRRGRVRRSARRAAATARTRPCRSPASWRTRRRGAALAHLVVGDLAGQRVDPAREDVLLAVW